MALELDPTYFDEAGKTFTQAAQYALPTEQERETASSRVRSRLAGSQRGLETQLRDQYAGRGWANTGDYQGALQQSRAASQSALGTSLADIEADWWKRRQEGANTLSGIGTGLSGLGTAQAGAQLGLGTLGLETEKAEHEYKLGLREQTTAEKEAETNRLKQVFEEKYGMNKLEIDQMLADIEGKRVEGELEIGRAGAETEELRQAFEETYGLGKLGLEEAGLSEDAKQRLAETAIDAFLAYGTFGRLPEDLEGTQVEQFNKFLERMFGSIGA